MAAARRTPYRPRPEPRRRPSVANAAHMGPALWSAPPTRVNSCLHADVATGSRLRAGGDPDLRHRVRRRYPPPQRAGRRVRACHRRWSAHPPPGREDRPRWAGRRALRLLAAGRVPAGGGGASAAPGHDSLLLAPLRGRALRTVGARPAGSGLRPVDGVLPRLPGHGASRHGPRRAAHRTPLAEPPPALAVVLSRSRGADGGERLAHRPADLCADVSRAARGERGDRRSPARSAVLPAATRRRAADPVRSQGPLADPHGSRGSGSGLGAAERSLRGPARAPRLARARAGAQPNDLRAGHAARAPELGVRAVPPPPRSAAPG